MKTRTILKHGITLASILAAVFFFSYAASDDSPFRPDNDPIHPVTFAKIQNGMTLGEVEAVLGKHRIYGFFCGYIGPRTWWGSRYIIHIELDNQGLVKNKTIEMHRYVTPTLADRYYKVIYGL